MRKREGSKRLINLGLVGLCIGLEIGVFAYYWETYFKLNLVMELRNLYSKATFAQITLYAVILLFLSATYGGMRLGYQKNAEIVFSQVLSTVMADMVLYLQLSLMARQLFVPKVFFIMFGVQVLIVIAYVNVANRLYRHLFPPRKLLLIHGDRPYQELCDKFESRSDKYVVTKRLSVKLGYEKLCKEIMDAYDSNECNAVVLGDISVQDRGPLLKFCYGKSIRVYLLPKITDVILTGAEELHVFDTPLLLTREYSLTVEQCFFKRMIDILGSLILIVPAAPIMLITAIVIKLYDGGPVLYKQVRCTKDQREFYIMKFRSMRTDAEKDGVARLASKNDDRITPVGRFIRKCRIDELPQLFNILKGDMSFIGPRPERPEIIAQYLEVMPEFALRMKVKAGLAGFAQIYGKYNTTPYDKLKLDLTYIQNYSIWMDLKLMLLTIKILFWPDSTEGVEAEQVTALKTQQAERNKK
ncbi:MAG: sugar transferase [Acetatifactor sp.]|nr:sugar transferase [Acetatifactor sp.]